MAIEYGWFGTLSEPTSGELSGMDGTALTFYMPYGLRTVSSWSTYETTADDLIDKVDGTDLKVLLEIPSAAVGNSSLVSSINTAYGSHADVLGFYLEEPDLDNRYDTGDVEDLRDGLDKDLVIDLRTASSQAVYNTWAGLCGVLAAPDYDLADSSDPWDDITALDALPKLESAKGSNFWHVMQAWEKVTGGEYTHTSTRREPTKPVISSTEKYYEMWWLAHRPFIDKARGLMLFKYDRASSGLHSQVVTMCTRIDYESFNRAFANLSDDHTDVNYVLNQGNTDILYRYQYFSSDWWLLVVDADPDVSTSYPKQVKFKCNLDSRYDDFIVLNNRYADYFTETNTDTGRSVYVTRDDPWMTFDETGSGYGLERGEVRLYRFCCGG